MSYLISKKKQTILMTLYQKRIILTYNLPLYAEYLKYTEGQTIGGSYLDRALRELIHDGYVEKIKIGYNAVQKTKCFERDTGRKVKNVYRLTRSGRNYVEEYLLEIKENNVGPSLSEATEQKKKKEFFDSNEELCEELGKSGRGKSLVPILRYDTVTDERTLRVLQTEIFGTVVAGREKGITFYRNEEFRKGIKHKGTIGSRVTGVFLIENLLEETQCIPIYNTGGYITLQRTKTESRMRDELRKKYGYKVQEEIVLGDSQNVLYESIRVLLKREYASREYEKYESASPLIIETSPKVKKYFHENSEAGIEQMKIYRIPSENRREYFREKLKERDEFKNLFTKTNVTASENDILFDAISKTAYVYVGYELEIERIKSLYSRMRATAMNVYDKGLIIICSKTQKKIYTKLFKDTKSREMQFLKILTTEGIP